jgi:peptidoglycan hydrolase-like protein with peptidoglycan-binding domain
MKKFILTLILLSLILSLNGCSLKKTTKDKTKITSPESSIQSQTNNNSKNKPASETSNAKKVNSTASAAQPKDILLRLGDSGEKVTELQKKLNKFKYNLTVDGKFGTSTAFALKNFQSKVKLYPDGIAGPQTFKFLASTPAKIPYLYKPSERTSEQSKSISYNNSCENFINSKDCPSNTNYYIYTNLSKHLVCIFTGSNHNWKLIKAISCSIGKASTPTIRGHFSVGAKGAYFVTNNGILCKYFTQISGNYLFHSILYDKKGNIVDDRPGENISHGCIRLSLENAKYIHDTIPTRTSIWIQ